MHSPAWAETTFDQVETARDVTSAARSAGIATSVVSIGDLGSTNMGLIGQIGLNFAVAQAAQLDDMVNLVVRGITTNVCSSA